MRNVGRGQLVCHAEPARLLDGVTHVLIGAPVA